MTDRSVNESTYKYLQGKSDWKPDLNGIDQTIVTVNIGPEAKDFYVHRDLICQVSPYFHGAFKGEFKEAQYRTITLDDISIRTFGIFQTWLYSGTLILPNDSDAYLDPERDHPKKCPECGNITAEDDGVADWPNDLVEIFVLADKYNVPLLRREAVVTIQHLDEISHTYPSAWLSCNAFERLPDTSPFCRYVVNMLKLWWDPESKTCPSCEDGNTVNFDAETMPRSLMFQMLKASHHRNEDGTLKIGKVNWCDYHEHGGKEEVRACRAKRKLEGRFGKFESLDGEDDSSDNESSGDKDMDQES